MSQTRQTAAARRAKAEAAKAEALESESVTVEWTPPRPDDAKPLRFVLPASAEDWPVDATEAFEDGKAATALRLVLGPDQWADFKATRPRNRDMDNLFDTIARTMGFNSSGESSASSV